MDQPSGMPTSYVTKDGTTFQYCGSGAPVVGLAAASRTGGQLKRDNTPEQVTVKIEPLPPPDAHDMMVEYHDLVRIDKSGHLLPPARGIATGTVGKNQGTVG